MTFEEFRHSIAEGAQPAGMSPELTSLWLAKSGKWEASHHIAQDIHTPIGSWIHALLHLMEGDTGNAHYWFARAGKPARGVREIDSEWEAIARELLA